jgi:hypothetical protein
MRALILFLIGGFCFDAPSATAAPLTYNFIITVFNVDDPSGLLSEIALGDTFNGSFTYDTAAMDLFPDEPDVGVFADGTSISFVVGGVAVASGAHSRVGIEVIPNELVLGEDSIQFFAIDPEAPAICGVVGCVRAPNYVILHFSRPTPPFNSDALPAEWPALSVFENSLFAFEMNTLETVVRVNGYITSLTPARSAVPEPTTLPLVGIGALAWAWHIKRPRGRENH